FYASLDVSTFFSALFLTLMSSVSFFTDPSTTEIYTLSLHDALPILMESFWSTMQIELLNRKKWKTRIELANAIFEYIEVFYNRRRRHSSLEYATPHDYDLARIPRALTTTGS